MDRQPLGEIQDKKVEPKEESWDKVGEATVGEDIDTIRNMKTLSLMFGLEDGFGDEAERARYMYEWSKQIGENPLDVMRAIIKKTGYQENGKLLLKKVYQWVRLQENIDNLKKEQELLS